MRSRTWSELTYHRAEAKPRLAARALSSIFQFSLRSFSYRRRNLARHRRVLSLDWVAD